MTTTEAQGEPAGPGELFTPCPKCSFGNPISERTCLFCAAPLPFFDATRRVSRRLLDREATTSAGPPAATAGTASTAPSRPSTPSPAPPPAASPPTRPQVVATSEAHDAAVAEPEAAPSSRLRRQEPSGASRPIGLLCCRPLPPLPLGPVPVVTIGRSPDCHVVLPHAEVSRHHCSIKVRRQHLVIEDEGSSNGTLVNERRVASADLKVGDVITIGPYVMEVLDQEQAAAWEAEDDAGSAVDVSHAMSGRLDEMPLAEVLQQLEFNARTGTLQVASGRRRGQVVLEEGRPLSAAFQRLRDEQAVLAMLALAEGRFSFVRTPDAGPRRMSGVTLTALLLESSRRADEGRAAVSSSDWDLQVEGGAQAPAIGSIGPPPRAARLSPAMRPGPPPTADVPADAAADTIVPDAPDAGEVPEPYASRDLIAEPGADTVVLAPGSLDADGGDGADDVEPTPASARAPARPTLRAAAREFVQAETLRARSDRLGVMLAPAEPAPAASPVVSSAAAPARRAALPWALTAALAIVCALLAARSVRSTAATGDDLRARSAALTRDLEQALTSPRSLVADAPAIAGLRGRLTALRATFGHEHGSGPGDALATPEAALSVLEGLAAAARGDAGGVSVALGRTAGAPISPPAASALLGAGAVVGVVGSPGDTTAAVEHLSRAIDGGVIRPELRAWRARLRGRAALEDVGTAATILDDLRVVEASIGLTDDDELLRARALLLLGRDEEAAPALRALGERHRAAALEVALARVEQALARGEVALAARRVVEARVDGRDPPPHALALAARVRRLSEPLLDDLRRGRSLAPAGQARLLDLLRIARLLGGTPLDEGAAAPLLDALDRPDEPLQVELCLGVAEVVGCDSEVARRRVLRRLYRAMERPDPADRGQADITLLICFVIGADPAGVARPADLLARVREPHARAELYHARALAREQLGRLRDAELDARRALLLEPERADLQALRARLAAAARSAPPPAPGPPPVARPRRRVG